MATWSNEDGLADENADDGKEIDGDDLARCSLYIAVETNS